MQHQTVLPGFTCQAHGSRAVQADFSAGHVTSDAGALLLREYEVRHGVLTRMAACFEDRRTPGRIEFSVGELVAQRMHGLMLGYEDLNDHDRLRFDPLWALLVGREDVEGHDRRDARDRGAPLAGKSTLNRVERSCSAGDRNPRYHKVIANFAGLDRLLVELAIEAAGDRPPRILLDLDASDVPLHGEQQGRFFHGYYDGYCYLPLYIFWGEMPVGVRVRRANIDAAAGCIDELERVVKQLRTQWPGVPIVIRGDSGFARESLMAWCEKHAVDYILGLARNPRLQTMLAPALAKARAKASTTGGTAREFVELRYRTEDSWSRTRRVVGKAEVLGEKDNPRFVVTSIGRRLRGARRLYELEYCARGEAENHIKEQQLDLFGTRMSTSMMPSNQLRAYFSAFAHAFMVRLRSETLNNTVLERATPHTIRLRLLRVGAIVRQSHRRILVSMASSFPLANVLNAAIARLRPAPA